MDIEEDRKTESDFDYNDGFVDDYEEKFENPEPHGAEWMEEQLRLIEEYQRRIDDIIASRQRSWRLYIQWIKKQRVNPIYYCELLFKYQWIYIIIVNWLDLTTLDDYKKFFITIHPTTKTLNHY